MEDFLKAYGPPEHSILDISRRWAGEQQARDFLGLPIFAGVVLGDLAVGGSLADVGEIPDEIVLAMKQIFSRKVSSTEEAVEFLADKFIKGEDSVMGAVNTIQGRIGEFHFQNGFGEYAELSDSVIQKYYDVKVSLPGQEINYVQVKVYKDADAAFSKFKDLNEAFVKGEVQDQGVEVSRMSFAVNDNLVDELSSRAEELNSNIKVLAIGADYDSIREGVTSSVKEIADHASYLDNFFEELLGGLVVGAALHAGVNGFLIYKKRKSLSKGVEDTIYSSLISGGGVAAGVSLELIQLELIGAAIGGPVGVGLALGMGLSARAILKRVADRRYFVERLEEGSLELEGLLKMAESDWPFDFKKVS